jgi:polyisoprenoid-binding protein YceI
MAADIAADAARSSAVDQHVQPEQRAACDEAAGTRGTVWVIDRGIGMSGSETGVFVGYRLREKLAQIGSKTVVGRTPTVSGCLAEVNGRVRMASVHADLRDLRSDSSQRDAQTRRQALESNDFPDGTFELTRPILLPDDLSRAPTTVTAYGDLRLHGVTVPVEFTIGASRTGDVVSVTGSTHIEFDDFGIDKPEARVVLRVDDEADVELQLFFTPAT